MPPPKRILCVEDHEDTCLMLTTLLKQAGFEAQAAHTISEALQMITSYNFDLFILDKHYPDGEGVELCQTLRGIFPQTPIIIYSGDVGERYQTEAIEAGASAYVSKPYVEELVEVVKGSLEDS